MDAWLDSVISFLAELMAQNLWFAPVLSLAAGVVTSFTPCSLAAVPMVLAYMEGSSSKDPHKARRLSLTMAAGMTVTFGVFGSVASLIGHFMHEVGHWWSSLMGVLMILMALQTWEIIRIFPRSKGHTHDHSQKEYREDDVHNCDVCGHVHHHGEGAVHHQKDCGCKAGVPKRSWGRGYAGAFFTGALSGVFASHCAAPVMVALLAIVAQSSHGLPWGIFLMFLYAVGHSILLVVAGTGYSMVDGWIQNPKYDRISRRLRIVLGAVILLIGLLMLLA